MKTFKTIIAVAVAAVALISMDSAEARTSSKGIFQDVQLWKTQTTSDSSMVTVTFTSSQYCIPRVDLWREGSFYSIIQSKKGRAGFDHTVVFYGLTLWDIYFIQISGANMKTFTSGSFSVPLTSF